MVPGEPKEGPKTGKYNPLLGEQGNMGTENKKGEYPGNSRVFGKTENFPPILENPVSGEYATKPNKYRTQ